jgi:hypothetical protein
MDEGQEQENSNQDPPVSLKDRVMVSVKSGRFKMRPKWHFVLRASLFAVGAILAALAGLYLASLLIFVAHETGIATAPAFGWPGMVLFLRSLPWVLILLVLAFMAILELLVRHYPFAYRMPLIYSGLAILFLVGAGGLLVATTPFHKAMAQCPPAGGPPPCAMGLYRDLEPERHNDIHEGKITRILGQNYIITDRKQKELLIIVTSRTRLPFGADFRLGDRIVIMGDRDGDQVEASGISPFDGRMPASGGGH